MKPIKLKGLLPKLGLLALSPFYIQACVAQSEEASGFPPAVQDKLQGLSQPQRDFLYSDKALAVFPREELIRSLNIREADDIPQYVSDMMAVAEAFAFDSETDMAEIPLNPEASVFNDFNVVYPEILKERWRDPGPFALTRYVHTKGSIPTFAGAPVAITPEDLVAGDVDIAIVGIPQNMSSGTRDSFNGPGALRTLQGMADRDIASLVDPAAVLSIVDYGDIAVDYMSIERSIGHVFDMIAEVIDAGATPFLVGGDHSLMYPAVKAVQESSDNPLTVVHFGAHYDAEPTGAHALTDRDAVYRLLSEGVIEGSSLIQVGLRGPQASPQAFEWLREQGVRYHTMAEVEYKGWPAVRDRVLQEATSGGKPLYISLDVSVIDPAELSAAGRASAGGLATRELAPLIRRMCAENEVAGFELMDLAPMLDLSEVSARNANYLLNSCLSGIAMRKQGLTEAHYLNELSVDHGQAD